MSSLVGEYDCKVDAKGRFLFPSGLRKQLDPASNEQFMVNRGFEKCLSLYPITQWEKLSAKLSKLNLFKPENRKFFRLFHNGAQQVGLDSAGRVLVPKNLLGYAGIEKAVVLIAYGDRVEIWDKEGYDSWLNTHSAEFADLADEVMGEDVGDE